MEKTIPEKRTARIWTAACLMLASALITAAIISGIIIPRFGDNENGIEIESEGEKHIHISSIKGDDAGAGAAESYALKHPGLLVEDENGVIWTSKLKRVEIFHLKYLGEDEYSVTVESSDKDKLIAPGTDNTYDFTVKNTGDTSLSYTLTAETETEGGMHIPLEIRLRSGDSLIKKSGIQTDKDGWADFEEFDGTKDSGVLSTKSRVSYSLDWKWPFGEAWRDLSGDDATSDNSENTSEKDIYDTLLGNMAVDEDLIVRVNLYILAQYDDPKTGDENELMLWLGIFAASLMLLTGLYILIHRRREDDRDEEG